VKEAEVEIKEDQQILAVKEAMIKIQKIALTLRNLSNKDNMMMFINIHSQEKIEMMRDTKVKDIEIEMIKSSQMAFRAKFFLIVNLQRMKGETKTADQKINLKLMLSSPQLQLIKMRSEQKIRGRYKM